jgi:hypothetical protein
MSIPEALRASVKRTLERYCEVPARVRDKLRYVFEFNGPRVTIYEERPPWDRRGDSWTRGGVARFRYSTKESHWILYWSDRNGRWHEYEPLGPVANFDEALAEVERDPTCIFWG